MGQGVLIWEAHGHFSQAQRKGVVLGVGSFEVDCPREEEGQEADRG